MKQTRLIRQGFLIALRLALIAGLLAACSMPATTAPDVLPTAIQLPASQEKVAAASPTQETTEVTDEAADAPSEEDEAEPELQSEESQQGSFAYTVQANDTLGLIAEEFEVDWEVLAAFNHLTNPNVLEIGQVLLIPSGQADDFSPDTLLIPDSELVYGPAAVYFDIAEFAKERGGYLATHRDSAKKVMTDGTEMVQMIANEYSVNPKVLLTLLEMESGWVTKRNPRTSTLEFPLGKDDSRRIGLYSQLAWAADKLNDTYYAWKAGQTITWTTMDGAYWGASPNINAGTAAIQALLAEIHKEAAWKEMISADGFLATYEELFGSPFDYAIEPLIGSNVSQPTMQLPFEDGVPWVFTGGPHSGWGYYAGLAALDFAPRGDQLGCWMSEDWVVAVADGLVIRSDDGAVVQDLDGDGYLQTGWTILYMHMAEYQRVPVGTYLHAGDRIGHPSCEGGSATASHLHLARRYNGEWIPASGDLPFNLDGWVSENDGVPYEGWLRKGDQSLEACECYDPPFMLER